MAMNKLLLTTSFNFSHLFPSSSLLPTKFLNLPSFRVRYVNSFTKHPRHLFLWFVHCARFLMFRCLNFAETMAKNSFKLKHPLERRQAEAARMRDKYPERIPVIVEKAERSDIPDIDKKKFLVPADLTVGQFVFVVRKRINVGAEKAIFVFINNTLPSNAALISAIYEENKDDDGFLYMTYSGENTFGSHLAQILCNPL